MTRQPRNIANPVPLNITKSNIELDFDYIAQKRCSESLEQRHRTSQIRYPHILNTTNQNNQTHDCNNPYQVLKHQSLQPLSRTQKKELQGAGNQRGISKFSEYIQMINTSLNDT